MIQHVDNPFQSPAVISFCPGILGIERGLKRVGVHPRVVAYLEIEAFIIANLVAGMESGMVDPAPIWTDAKTFDASPFRGRIHGIIGGYPCTPFSVAGTRSGENHPGHIYPFISGAIEAARPLWCFFENVDDHLTLGFDRVYQDLYRMGYAVEAGIYTAEEVGAPHERKRLFILALADAYRDELRRRFGQIYSPRGANEITAWLQNGEWLRDEFSDSGEEMAYTNGIGRAEQWFVGFEKEKRINGVVDTGSHVWPAGPGEHQFEWEEPRTIESGFCRTIDGYNFREDLLRALGNSVVEQTAEIAFIDLLNKHLPG